MIEQLKKWMIENHIDFTFIDKDIVEINGAGKFFVFDNGNENVFCDNLNLNLCVANTYEEELFDEGLLNTIYKFGDIFYYTTNDIGDESKADMTPLQSVGKSFLEISDDYTHLGVHGHRELLNGSGDYEDYVKKAVFFGYKALGICEKNTLAGTMIFQNSH